jgi:hypothetical protein
LNQSSNFWTRLVRRTTRVSAPQHQNPMLSGDVTQTFNINLGTSSDPAIEKQVLSDHASYGKQLGRIGEALIVLLSRHA